MITRIELENFKGVRDKVALDLKPITLLFGANSSGKSTVIHALHYAHEVLQNRNLDADRTTLGGDVIDLGGFVNLVHGHDLNRRIRLRFDFNVEGGLSDYTEGVSDLTPAYQGPPGPGLDFADLENSVFTGWVRVEVGWSRRLSAPQVFSYEVGVGAQGQPVVRIEGAASEDHAASLALRVHDDVFVAAEDDETEVTRLAASAGLDILNGVVSLPVYRQGSALPVWGRPLRLWLIDDMEPIPDALIELRRIVSRLAVGLGETLLGELRRLLYVGPLRAVPPRNYRPPLTDEAARWADGMGAWDALHRNRGDLVRRASAWMLRLGTGYRLEQRSVAELDGVAAATLQDLIESNMDQTTGRQRIGARGRTGEQWRAAVDALQAAARRHEVVLVDNRSGAALMPFDVGVGISQVLPVVVAALSSGHRGAAAFLAVEQPELHIHPKLQVELADLFIEQSQTRIDHLFLLETHSEHILLRLLRRIREASDVGRGDGLGGGRGDGLGGGRAERPEAHVDDPVDEDVADAKKSLLTPDSLSVIYVQRGEDGATQFIPLRIDSAGEFLDAWPEGFFDERGPELY